MVPAGLQRLVVEAGERLRQRRDCFASLAITTTNKASEQSLFIVHQNIPYFSCPVESPTK